jgi:hypothetical protein
MQVFQWFSNNAGFFQAIGALATAVSIVWLVKQAITNRKTYNYNSEWQEKNKAVELAHFYQHNILDKIGYIEFVMKNTKVLEDVAKIGDFNEFTASELHRKTGNQQFDKEITAKISAEENNEVFISANLMFKDRDISNLLGLDSPELLKGGFFSDVSSLLNSMEYFSMCFITGVADETVVYQSLHQSFFKCVRMLYWAIARLNTNPKDKYYSYLAQLYSKWSARDAEKERQQNSVVNDYEAIKK